MAEDPRLMSILKAVRRMQIAKDIHPTSVVDRVCLESSVYTRGPRGQDILVSSKHILAETKGQIPIPWVRQAVCYLLMETAEVSSTVAAGVVNRRNHATALHARKRIGDYLEMNKSDLDAYVESYLAEQGLRQQQLAFF